MINGKQINEWRALKNDGMRSAIGEYTPEEFWEALDDIERLRSCLRGLLLQVENCDGTAQLDISRAENLLKE